MTHIEHEVLERLVEDRILPDEQEEIWNHLERDGGGCKSCWEIYQECILGTLDTPFRVWPEEDVARVFGRVLTEDPRMAYAHDTNLVWELDAGLMDKEPMWVLVSFDPSEEWYVVQVLLNVKEKKERPGGSGKTHLITKRSDVVSVFLLVKEQNPRSGVVGKPGYYPTVILHRVTELDKNPAQLIREFMDAGCYVIATCVRESLGSLPGDERTRSVYDCYTDEEDEGRV